MYAPGVKVWHLKGLEGLYMSQTDIWVYAKNRSQSFPPMFWKALNFMLTWKAMSLVSQPGRALSGNPVVA